MSLDSNIIHGDSAEELKKLPTESVHLVVTSPPYFNLKDYKTDDQLGHEESLQEYTDALLPIWRQCIRVLKPGCKLAVNVGDAYISSSNEPYHVLPSNSYVDKSITEIDKVLPMGSIIWHKISTQNNSGGGSFMGSWGKPRNGIVTYEHEYINIYKKEGDTPPNNPDTEEDDSISTEEWKKWFSGHWKFPGERKKRYDHPAPFPEELPRRLIRMYSCTDDMVVDPFAGSGTTGAVADRLDRRFIMIDSNKEYVDKTKERCGFMDSIQETMLRY